MLQRNTIFAKQKKTRKKNKMMDELLDKLLLLPLENEVVEFKEAKKQFDKDTLGEYFSALANEANLNGQKQSWLVFGVRNDKSIVGTTISDKQINEYKVEIGRHTSPKCSFNNVFKLTKQGKDVLMFEIPPAPQGQPVSWKGHRYGREGESLVALSDIKYDKIKSQINTKDWSEQIIEDATIEDLSKEAIDFARTQYAEKNPKIKDEIESWSDELFLNKAKITIKGKITNTAILLLGNPDSEHFISPATTKITWILKDKDNVEKDHDHFFNPLIFAVKQVSSKIRNLKYRYIKSDTLFPDEVDQYDPYIIRESLHNCIAHQDYTLGERITVVENEDGYLIFSNAGGFIPESVEEVVISESPESKYRNPFLSNAMVSLNMIETIGSGIKRMYNIQRKKFFPLPEYDLSSNKVKVTFIGKVINLDYARKLAKAPNLSLNEIMLLDKVAKQKLLSDEEAKTLRAKKLIEGRKPNFYISSDIAGVTGEKAAYIKHRGFKDEYYKNLILEYLNKYQEASKKEINDLILDILPFVLDKEKKDNKIKNIVYAMSKKDETIVNKGTRRNPIWTLSLSKK